MKILKGAMILLGVLSVIYIADAKKHKRSDVSQEYSEKYDRMHNYNKHHRPHGKYKNHKDTASSVVDPPDHNKNVAMARYVVHQADWTSVATLSSIDTLKGFPFSNIVSMADGPISNSTGIPYFYLTHLDFSSQDLQKDSRCTISVTLEETDYCHVENLDPEDPRCARVMLSGNMKKVPIDTSEYDYAKGFLFARHPTMNTFPTDHHFYVAKLKISQIYLLDWYGGAKFIGVQEYLAFKPEKLFKGKALKDEKDIGRDFHVITV